MEYWDYPFDKGYFWRETKRWTDRKNIDTRHSDVSQCESTILYMTRTLEILEQYFQDRDTFVLEYNEIINQRKAILEIYKKLNIKYYEKFVGFNPKVLDHQQYVRRPLIEKIVTEKKPKAPIIE